jgi:DNA repair exonuclease SbcCD ATPase subunit/predicted phosphodiesterase
MKKFAHIADTHIRNLKYHTEYKEVFSSLYKRLKEEKVDYIIHCGDIAHTKTQISPEFVDLCSDFFRNLANIAPTYIILGNHDGNLRNFSRLDALSPIVEALDIPTLHLAKKSSQIALESPYVLNVLSIFDKENWDLVLDEEKINIALYHGAVKGAKTDVGYTIEHGDVDIQTLKRFDYAFLGDIHKSNQVLDSGGKIRYAGSTVQQNHGESDDKGFLIWEILGKKEYSVEHVSLKNPKPFKTINLTPKGRIPKNVSVPKGCRLRLVANSNVSLDVLRKALNVAKVRFKPEALTFLNRTTGEQRHEEEADSFLGNLRDVTVQEELMKEYLKDYEVEDEVLEKVFELNKNYNSAIEQEEEQLRNVNWKLKSMEWSNLFNYGEGNSIDFEKLNGIVGIFGKNFSGKSSIIDSLLLGLYNSTSKPAKKNINFVNQNKQDAEISLTIGIGNKDYIINRRIEKYQKKLKGKVTDEARVDLDFDCCDTVMDSQESLNGLTRANTDANIKKYLGSIEDFLITSMSSQHGSLQFVNEGSTKRKEILAKFLDLVMFDQKFQLAKEDSSDLKGALKRMEDRQYDDEIFEIEKDLIFNEAETREKKECCDDMKVEISVVRDKKRSIEDKIQSVPAKIINIERAKENLSRFFEGLEIVREQNNEISEDQAVKKELLSKISEFVGEFDIETYNDKKEIIDLKTKQLGLLQVEIKQQELKEEMEKKKVSLLNEVPCGSEFSHCKFIKDAYSAKREIETLSMALDSLDTRKNQLKEGIITLEPAKVDEYIHNYEQVLSKKNKTKSDLTKLELKKVQNNNKIKTLEGKIDELKQSIEEYNNNREAIENLEKLLTDKKRLINRIKKQETDYNTCEAEYIHLHTVAGQLQQKLEDVQGQKQEHEDMQQEFAAYHLFMTCCHSSGISYEIIKKKLPVINNEVQKILTNVVDFEVFFESEDKKLNILIKHPQHAPRPLELGSGAEKAMAAMAIRLALLNVSSLPKSDLFIMDEPGTALDESNLEGFTRIIDLVKSYFKTVFLISHMDSLKDIVDTTINIEKIGGYARVNQ